MTVRVLLVEDEADVRERLARAIAAEPGFELVAAVGSCAEARAEMAATPAEVLVVDLGLPDGRGSDLIRDTLAQRPAALAMVVTVFGDEAHIVEAIEAGASSYLLKDASSAHVGRALRQMLDGGSPISPHVARHLLRRMRREGDEAEPSVPLPTTAASSSLLSGREHEVLLLVSKGYSYAEIGRALDISVNTVGTHVKQIYRKLAVNSRSAAVFEAQQQGLLSRPHAGSR
jgi:DNA-binding NarL/FixJ family response regulator